MKVICDILWHSEFEWICSSAMNLWHRRTWTFGHSRSSPKTKTLLCSNACLTRAWRRWGEAVASFMLLCLVPGGSWASRKLHKSWDLMQLLQKFSDTWTEIARVSSTVSKDVQSADCLFQYHFCCSQIGCHWDILNHSWFGDVKSWNLWDATDTVFPDFQSRSEYRLLWMKVLLQQVTHPQREWRAEDTTRRSELSSHILVVMYFKSFIYFLSNLSTTLGFQGICMHKLQRHPIIGTHAEISVPCSKT